MVVPGETGGGRYDLTVPTAAELWVCLVCRLTLASTRINESSPQVLRPRRDRGGRTSQRRVPTESRRPMVYEGPVMELTGTPSSVGLSSLSRDPSWPLASSQLRREKMRYFALRSNFITPLPLLLLPPARLTIASHNIFLRTLKRG